MLDEDNLFDESEDELDLEGGEADRLGLGDQADAFNSATPTTSVDVLGDVAMDDQTLLDTDVAVAQDADAAMQAGFNETYDNLFEDEEDDLFGDNDEDGDPGQITDGALASGGLGDIAALSQMNLETSQGAAGDLAGLAGLAGPSYAEVGMRRRVEGADDDDDDSDEESD